MTGEDAGAQPETVKNNMEQPGSQMLTVSCTVRGQTFTEEILIRIVSQSETWK